jgi:hypothetical protein
MKNLIILIAGLLTISLPGCIQTNVENTDSQYTIKYVLSFGECSNECFKELLITESEAILKVQTWVGEGQSEFQVRGQKLLIEDEYQNIYQSIDLQAFQFLPNVIGCPDCVDGGAESIEILTNDIQKRITFEYLNAPKSLQQLTVKLRGLQEELYVPAENSSPK